MKIIFIFYFLTSFQLTELKAADIHSYQALKKHKVFKVVEGRWQGEEFNEHTLTGKNEMLWRDFRIGSSLDGSRLIFESLVKNDNYVGYFSYYDEDCLQYDEYGKVQHLCLGPSGYVAWSGPCSAGSYRTNMTRKIQDGQVVIVKAGDHWNHEGRLHRRNSGVFIKVD